MTIELYRPGVEKQMVLPEGSMFEVLEKNGNVAVLVSLREREGFKEYLNIDIPEYLSQNYQEREKVEKRVVVYKSDTLLQLADGLVVKAT